MASLSASSSTPSWCERANTLGSRLVAALKLLSRAQRWEELPQHIDDDILNTFVTIGTYDKIGRQLCERYGKVVTHCEFSIAVRNDADREILRGIAKDIQSDGAKT